MTGGCNAHRDEIAEGRLDAIAANGRGSAWSADEILDGTEVVVPRFLSRRAYVAAVSQLHHGEVATVGLCRRLLRGSFGNVPAARVCIENQIVDEIRHADAYRAYLESVGDIVPPDPAVVAYFEAAEGWPDDPDVGAVLAYHVVLEGEALRMQLGFATWLPCPAFRALNGRIARDEARHVGFGRAVLERRIAAMPPERRRDLLRWIETLWWEAAAAILGRFSMPGLNCERLTRKWLESRWRRQVADLAVIGLGGDGRRASGVP